MSASIEQHLKAVYCYNPQLIPAPLLLPPHNTQYPPISIFRLKREVLDFRRAVDPLVVPVQQLAAGDELLDPRSRPYFRDVQDHTLRVADRLQAVDALLDSALQANVAQVGMQQNEDMGDDENGRRAACINLSWSCRLNL